MSTSKLTAEQRLHRYLQSLSPVERAATRRFLKKLMAGKLRTE